MLLLLNSLSAIPAEWLNIFKQFVGFCRRIVWVFDDFVALKGLRFLVLNVIDEISSENSLPKAHLGNKYEHYLTFLQSTLFLFANESNFMKSWPYGQPEEKVAIQLSRFCFCLVFILMQGRDNDVGFV